MKTLYQKLFRKIMILRKWKCRVLFLNNRYLIVQLFNNLWWFKGLYNKFSHDRRSLSNKFTQDRQFLYNKFFQDRQSPFNKSFQDKLVQFNKSFQDKLVQFNKSFQEKQCLWNLSRKIDPTHLILIKPTSLFNSKMKS